MQKFYRRPHRYKRKKSIFRNRFFWLGVLIFIIIGATFYFLFFSEVFQVEKIILTGGKKVSTEEIKQFIEGKLEGKVLFFRTKSIFSVNLDETGKNILDNFPQISEVKIKRGLPDVLNVLVTERLGLAIWCRQDRCFLLDKEGIIFEEIPGLETEMAKIKDQTLRNNLKLGEKVIEKDVFSEILKIESELKSGLKIPIKEFIVSSEEKLTAVTGGGWEIYLNLKSDVEWQMTKLRVVLEEKIPEEKRGDLEYIELRFGNFAPFKYRD